MKNIFTRIAAIRNGSSRRARASASSNSIQASRAIVYSKWGKHNNPQPSWCPLSTGTCNIRNRVVALTLFVVLHLISYACVRVHTERQHARLLSPLNLTLRFVLERENYRNSHQTPPYDYTFSCLSDGHHQPLQ
jgi:hypothetical protein